MLLDFLSRIQVYIAWRATMRWTVQLTKIVTIQFLMRSISESAEIFLFFSDNNEMMEIVGVGETYSFANSNGPFDGRE